MTLRPDDGTPDSNSLDSRLGATARLKDWSRKGTGAEGHGGEGTHPDGEIARLIETIDWSRSALGPLAQWPRSLMTALHICLASRFQLAIFWGPELIFLYNDAEREVIGSLHPRALGKPAREILVDMWDTVGPMLCKVMASGEATWSVDQPLMIDRYGLLEEAFFTWSYSPIPDDSGRIGGVLLVTEETTQRVLAERRLRALKEMASETAKAQTVELACTTAMRIVSQAQADIPFALLYLMDAAGSVRLCSSTAVGARPGREQFPFEEVVRRGEVVQIENLSRFFNDGIADQLPKSALILPIVDAGFDQITGFLVAGVSDHRRLDSAYRNFFDLVAAQIGTNVASARGQEQERIRLNAIAELDRAKTAFFTNISHEFRTPLTLILGVVDDLLAKSEQESSNPNRVELSVAHRNGVRLLRLVNTLMAFSGLEAGRIRAAYRPTDLAALTAELAGGFRSVMDIAGLVYRVEVQALPEPVYVDPDMWEKIVLNLVSNAFKFTLQGEVSLTLSSVDRAAQLTVKDTGVGIHQDELPRIFERFHRVEGSRGRAHEGTGIGLALVQELVKLHGGSIRAESLVGEGTTFVVTIPYGTKHLPPDQIHGDGTQVPVGASTSGYVEEAWRWLPDRESVGNCFQATNSQQPSDDRPFILVADDNADMRKCFQSLLNDRYSVETVADGEQALAVIERKKPALLIADVMMPNLDGFNLLRRLRADPETWAIPIIMVSARAGEEERIEGMEHGADDYLVKPFRFRELRARIQSVLELARIRRETAERERKLRAEADSQRALLETVLKEMPAGVVIARAPSGEVMLANHQAEQILQRSVSKLHGIEEYSDYQLFRLNGSAYELRQQPLARSIQRGEVVLAEELKYLRPDGTFRVLLANSAPVRDKTGAIVASVVAFQDITDLRQAQEEVLRRNRDVIDDLAGRLITAQEEERRRLARELHDDISQRLALLLLKIEKASKSLDDGRAPVKEQLEKIWKQCSDLAKDVQALSHELHPASLDTLGLVAAVKSFCREFSEETGATVEFIAKDVPPSLPREIALSLFRVIQEALHNAAKYSGEKCFAVHLESKAGEIELEVSDRGTGFDMDGIKSGTGLGLVSMSERIHLLQGRITIESRSNKGTRIFASVPLSFNAKGVTAAAI